MICARCGKEFFEDWRKDTKRSPCSYCGPSCSHSRDQTEDLNKRRSRLLRKVEVKYCSQCGKILAPNNKSVFCQACKPHGRKSREDYQRIQNNKHMEFKRLLVEYMGGKCEICGYNKCIKALEFHHISPLEKEFSLSDYAKSKNLEIAKVELSKCKLLCSNCHRELHDMTP